MRYSEDTKNIIIESVSLEDIINQDKKRYNSNNHWINDKRPDDYKYIVNRVQTSDWINEYVSNYQVFNFDDDDLTWMRKANDVCSITGNFSHLFDEEMAKTIKKYENIIFDDVHIRTEKVSLKYGKNGVIKYNNMVDIIESLVSSICNHCPLRNIEKLKLYLIPWKEINPLKEFRIFVYNNNITAISQQELYTINTIASNKNIFKWIEIILNYFDKKIKNKFIDIKNYSIDFAILDDDTPYFIEINSFGKEYAAGSALFHWLVDEEILYGNGDDIHFRWTCK